MHKCGAKRWSDVGSECQTRQVRPSQALKIEIRKHVTCLLQTACLSNSEELFGGYRI